jgi:catechol 2,3-dioxygenase-like lactoylglutathione lyase family enzyme
MLSSTTAELAVEHAAPLTMDVALAGAAPIAAQALGAGMLGEGEGDGEAGGPPPQRTEIAAAIPSTTARSGPTCLRIGGGILSAKLAAAAARFPSGRACVTIRSMPPRTSLRLRRGAVATYGLTHVALGVRDVERAFRFYQQVLGAVLVYRGDGFIQAQTPGARDVLVFEQRRDGAGRSGDIAHFGFRLVTPRDIRRAITAVRRAGGTILERGEFVPGEPYLFARDPDGYTIELWYELPTPIDPRS